jgi:hypothetical protein
MANLTFEEMYISVCDTCGADLEDWDWLEDDLVFWTACSCGAEYILKPTMGDLSRDVDILDDDGDDEEDE